MPLPQLPGTVACALLPIDADEGAASWIPVVRAAVRRTQQRLFLLFTGALASRDPCEGLTQLASAALEVAAAEGRPRLCVVPLFPTAGWADLAAGKTPAGRQAATLKDVQVVFAAAAPSPAARASTGEHSATASDAGQSGGSGSSGSGAGGSGRGRVVYHRSSKKGAHVFGTWGKQQMQACFDWGRTMLGPVITCQHSTSPSYSTWTV